MLRKGLFGIGYVSCWVIIWGTIGSLVDLPFLNSEIYSVGSLGQAITFVVTAILCLAVGVWIYPKVLSIRVFSNFVGLNID